MSDNDTEQMHATCVAIGNQGVLLRGAPGSGKSDLALRLIDHPGYGIGTEQLRAELVGDDQIVVTRHGDGLTVSPATKLAGLLEIRGIGIVACPHRAEVELALVVDLESQDALERLPEPRSMSVELLGVSVPRISIDAGLASAPARVRAGLLVMRNSALDSDP